MHDRYLSALPDDQRTALEKLRQQIKAAAPKAEESMNYGIPGFRLNDRLLVSFGAAKNHCAFYPGSIVQKFKKELKAYDANSKGTIRFSPNKPLPAALVRKIVKARIAQQS